MRVALVATRSDVFGGAITHVRDLGLGLAARGHEVRVLIGGHGPMVDHLRARGLDVTAVPHLVRNIDPVRDPQAIGDLTAGLRRYRPDVVHAHTAKAGLLTRVAAQRIGLPCVYTPHAWPFLPGVPEPSRSRYLRIERAAALLPSVLIDVCEFERDIALRSGVGREDQHTVVLNGVPDVASRSAGTRTALPQLVMVARFEPQKDHETFLRALSGIKELAWRALLVGDGPNRPDVEALVRRLGLADRVELTGDVDDVGQVLTTSHLAVLTSHWEAMPLTVLESMRAGLPVVATAVGGVPEAVRDGVTGRLIDPSDHVSLSRALRTLVLDPRLRERLGAAGRRRYEELFTLDRMVDATVDAYERARSSHRRPTVRTYAGRSARTGVHVGRRLTSPQRRGPDFLIIGAQKGGTTALYRYLSDHPLVAPATAKEIHYFDLHYERGPGWYRSHFPLRPAGGRCDGTVTGEASPYYLFHPLVPQRVAADVPESRLIVLLRDPVRRAYSHYHHERSKHREHLSFEAAIEAEPRRIAAGDADVRCGVTSAAHRRFSYLARGRYAEQLEGWLRLFPMEQLLILRSEDLHSRPQETLDRVCGFLDLPPHRLPSFPEHNLLRYPPLAADTQQRLQEYFRPHNQQLRQLTGDHRLDW